MQPQNHRSTLLVFQLGERQYAVEAHYVEQITAMAELILAEGRPRFLLGFLNLCGEAVPVVALRSVLGLPEPRIDLWTPLLLLRVADRWLALLVDQVNRVARVGDDALLPVPAGQIFNDCVKCTVSGEDEPILLLCPERLLLEKERRAIAEFQETAQQRILELAGAVS